MDGWITIGTKLSTDEFDKQVSDLENKIDSEEKKQELLNRKTEEYKSKLESATKEVNKLTDEYDRAVRKAEIYKEALEEAKKVTPRTPKFFGFEADYNRQVEIVEELAKELEKAEKNQASFKDKVDKTKLQLDNCEKSADRLRNKIGAITLKKQENSS